MDFDFEEILKDLLKNERILKRVEELSPTKEALLDGISILIEMNDEGEERNTLTSFDIDEKGRMNRISVLSPKGQKKAYLDNVKTNNIYEINFEDEKEFFKEEGRKDVANFFSKFIREPGSHMHGFYLYGEMGVGKTFMLKRFAKMLAENGRNVGFVNVSTLANKIKATFSSDTKTEQATLVKQLEEVDYLFLDDIGAEKISSWFRDEVLFNILNERMERRRITFFTSNFSIDALQKKQAINENNNSRSYDKAKRLVSRIRALAQEFHIEGENKRKIY
ncbi:MAG: ATP-binding protein [Mycoplasmataceae bacterium]|nr:ATP-binding protein [Mycoplasmataceae bacterium]